MEWSKLAAVLDTIQQIDTLRDKDQIIVRSGVLWILFLSKKKKNKNLELICSLFQV